MINVLFYFLNPFSALVYTIECVTIVKNIAIIHLKLYVYQLPMFFTDKIWDMHTFLKMYKLKFLNF